MSVIDTLIIDRTPDDFYGSDDFNRVGRALLYIAERLRTFGILVPILPRTDWKYTEHVTQEDALEYLNDVKTIRVALSMPPDLPEVPDGIRPFDAQEANDIERILVAVYDMIHNVRSNIDLGWALGTSYTGLYAAAPSLRLMTESGALLVDARERQPDLLHLPEGGAGQIVVEYNGGNYLCEVT